MIFFVVLVGFSTVAAYNENIGSSDYPAGEIHQDYLPDFPVHPVQSYAPGGAPAGGGGFQPPNTIFYTSLLRDLDKSTNEANKHLANSRPIYTKSGTDNAFVQYTMILYAANQLVETLLKTQLPYDVIYMPVVTETIMKTSRDPLGSANTIKARLEQVNRQIAGIREFIRQEQEEACQDTSVYECNLIIGKALRMNADPVLQKQAKLLSAFNQELKLYLRQYAAEFERVAYLNEAEEYLINGAQRLKPFVIAIAEARKIGLNLPIREI